MKRWVNRRHATVAKLAATSLVVTLLGTMHQAAFADSISSGNGITFGQVFSNGEPESGVTVTAVIWPKSSILANLSAGAPVTRLNAGSVATNSNGTFEVDISPTSISSDYKENDGSVSVELYVADSTRAVQWGYSARFDPTPSADSHWALSNTTTDDPSPSPDLQVDLGAGTVWDTNNDPANWVDEQGVPIGLTGRATAATVEIQAPNAGPLCTYTPTDTWHYDVGEHFVNAYAWTGGKAKITQSATVTHSLGYALSADSTFAHMTFGGSIGETYGNGTTHIIRTGWKIDKGVSNDVNFRDFQPLGSLCKWERRGVSAYDFLDDGREKSVQHAYYGNCVEHDSGSWSANQATSATYRYGIDLGPISVSAQSGYTKGTTIEFTFTSISWVCGNNVAGPLQSSQVETARL